MNRNELQNYIIKRQYIKHVKLLDPKYTENPVFESKNNMHAYMNYNEEFTFSINTSLLKPVVTDDRDLSKDVKIFDDLWDFEYNFKEDAVILAQWLLLEISPARIITGYFTPFERYTLPEIHMTREFLQWDFPSIKEMVIAYLDDNAWKKFILPFVSFSDIADDLGVVLEC